MALILTAGLVEAAVGPVGGQIRISSAGPDGDTSFAADDAEIAYNSTDDEYLVVWEGEGLATDDELELFGQRVSAAGEELGTDFRISNVGTDGTTTQNVFDEFAVAYNSTANQYLVVWAGENVAANDFEIFGQRLSATGAQIPDATDFQISSTVPAGEEREAGSPQVAYNSSADEYLVVWRADDLATDNELEVFGQRIDADGTELAPDDFRISNTGTDGQTAPKVFDPHLAYNSATNEYLVAWSAEGFPTANKVEIFGQRIEVDGDQTPSAADFQISTTGDATDVNRGASFPRVAYNPAANQFLVIWNADPMATDSEFEVFGQLLSAAGADASTEFRISNVGADGDATDDADEAAVAYDAASNQYLAVWFGDGLASSEDRELFGQLVAAVGGEVGTDFRISTTGTDGDGREAFEPAVASSGTGRYLVSWQADSLPTDNELEIFASLVAESGGQSPAAGGSASPPSNAFMIGKLKGKQLTLLVPGPGAIDVNDTRAAAGRATASARARLIKHSRAVAAAAGAVRVALKLTKKAKQKLAERGRVKVKASIKYTPAGGAPAFKTKKLKIRAG